MPTELYRFDAPDGSKLLANDREYEPGDVVELPAGQVDPRLSRVEDLEEGEVVQGEADSADEVDAKEPEVGTPENPLTVTITDTKPATGFGNPKPKAAR